MLCNMKDDREESYSSIMNTESVSGIIRYLADHGESMNINLKVIVGNHYRLHNIMEALRDAGLIGMKYETSPKKIYRYWLTEKGKRVAKKLEEIEDILNEG